MGQFVDAAGNKQGAPFVINEFANGDQTKASIAYDSNKNQFLVVWVRTEGPKHAPTYSVMAQYLQADGKLLDECHEVYTGIPLNELEHRRISMVSCAYDAANHKFFVIWSHKEENPDSEYDYKYSQISGVFFDAEKPGYETPFKIADTEQYIHYDKSISLAYDSRKGRFLVVWEHEVSQSVSDYSISLYGQFVQYSDSGNVPAENAFPIGSSDKRCLPSAAYNNGNHQFVITCIDGASFDSVYGLQLDADNPDKVTEMKVYESSFIVFYPKLIFNTNARGFWAVWRDSDLKKYDNITEQGLYDGAIRGRFISLEGKAGDPVHKTMCPKCPLISNSPAAATNSSNNSILVAFESNGGSSSDYDHAKLEISFWLIPGVAEISPAPSSAPAETTPTAKNSQVPSGNIISQDDKVTVDLKETSGTVSADQIDMLVNLNKEVPAVFSGEGYAITYPIGSMKLTGGRREYDFGVRFNTGQRLSDIRSLVGDSFVLMLEFNHSGELPGEAQISFFVDAKYSGKELYYYYFNPQKAKLEYIQSAIVDNNNLITIRQSRCSSYVFTLRKLSDSEMLSTAKGGVPPVVWWVLLSVPVIAVVLVVVLKKRLHKPQ